MTADMTTDSNASPPEPTEKSSKVTRARVTPSGLAPRGRRKGETKPVTIAATPPTAEPPTTAVRADRVEISQGGAGNVEATTVTVTQGGIGTARADAIDLSRGGIGQAWAKDIAVSIGSIGLARGERVSVEMGAIGAIAGAQEVRLSQGTVGFTMAREATIDQSLVSTLVAERVTIRQPSAVLLLIARQVDGAVRPLLDWRGAIAAGAAAGVVISLLRRGRR